MGKTQNALLCSRCNSGYTSAPQCYVAHTLPVLFTNLCVCVCRRQKTPEESKGGFAYPYRIAGVTVVKWKR